MHDSVKDNAWNVFRTLFNTKLLWGTYKLDTISVELSQTSQMFFSSNFAHLRQYFTAGVIRGAYSVLCLSPLLYYCQP